MKNLFFPFYVIAVLMLSGGIVQAGQMPGHVAEAAVGSSHADVVKHKACPHCGMDREKFAYSRMLITYSDGSSVGVCSFHCAVTELEDSKGKVVKTVEVADFNSRILVDVKKTTWVIGGSKKGVMTRVPKWAFAKKADAVAFITKNGGKLATYKETLELAENN